MREVRMPILGKRRRLRLLATAIVACILSTTGLGIPVSRAAADEPVSATINVTGRGWGHGRGLGQWGAFGYATGRSGGPWDYRAILAHFYGETEIGSIGNPLAAVDLLGQRAQALVVEQTQGVTVAGLPGTSVAVRATLRDDGRFDVERGTACADGTWGEPTIVDGPIRLSPVSTTGDADDALGLCRADGSRAGYRGDLVALGRTFDKDAAGGTARTVNLLTLDDLLRSVVPRQVPAAWAGVDGGRGLQAILAQVVAARGFAASGDGRWGDLHTGLGAAFTTCDSAACQPYVGVQAEDSIIDDAVGRTSGEVRKREGTVVRTEFSASSGGWTAGGAFPAVSDVGDGVRDNPHHLWTATIQRSDLEAHYKVGTLEAVQILERNGFGSDGGRVLRMRLVGSDASVELTGIRFRDDFGLRSSWFTLKGAPPRPAVVPRSTSLACPVGSVPASSYIDVRAADVHRFAVDCATWWTVAKGDRQGRFRPREGVTRGQLASMAARVLERAGATAPRHVRDAFADDDGTEHEADINALASFAVMSGFTSKRFEPQWPVTRAQVAAVLGRAVQHLGIALRGDAADAFADDVASPYEPSINGLADLGILTGASAGFLHPDDGQRRDQLASLLVRTIDLLVERGAASRP
ncbi:MAG: S-layer homology domain-containing protein [Acidimicrobiales bacterium]